MMQVNEILKSIQENKSSWNTETLKLVEYLYSSWEADNVELETYKARVEKQWPTVNSNLYTEKEYNDKNKIYEY